MLALGFSDIVCATRSQIFGFMRSGKPWFDTAFLWMHKIIQVASFIANEEGSLKDEAQKASVFLSTVKSFQGLKTRYVVCNSTTKRKFASTWLSPCSNHYGWQWPLGEKAREDSRLWA
ncbi:Uncharacterised protein [Citrobacter koseri]|uniref:Uncharacterized protein n=1 Tax=Citrobacter koseri TaxID=545 RepID=A0A2X2VMB6_CITKO|nr:Uncharacterised protein [Citrobacter koseri]